MCDITDKKHDFLKSDYISQHLHNWVKSRLCCLLLVQVHVFALNIVLDIIFIDLRAGKSEFELPLVQTNLVVKLILLNEKHKLCAVELFISILINRDRTNLVMTENVPKEKHQ